MRKVLLLNPPSNARDIRDQFCSHRSKGAYYWQPLDLLILSGQLDAEGFDVCVLDAVAESLGRDVALRRAAGARPEAVVFLTGGDTFAADVAFVTDLKQRTGALAVGIGDVLRDDGLRLLAQHTVIDACLNDFVVHGLAGFLRGHPEQAANMVIRTPGGLQALGQPDGVKRFTTPAPRYDLFPLGRYRMPFNRYHPYAAVIASSWCPYRCQFCPFAGTPFRLREIDDIVANLDAVRQLGIRQIHFADWTFGVNRAHTLQLLGRMPRGADTLSWSCLSRVDLVDRDLARAFRAAGCHLVEFGVESGAQELLDRYQKGTTLGEIRAAFAACHAEGIDTLATFVLGLPGETEATLEASLALATELEPAYCSFNIASPRWGTHLRAAAVRTGELAAAGNEPLDSSWSAPTYSAEQLPAEQLRAFRRRAIRRFYLRPAYLRRRVLRLHTASELRNQFVNGAAMLSQTWRSSRLPPRV